MAHASSRSTRLAMRFILYGPVLFGGLIIAFSQTLISVPRAPTTPVPAAYEELKLTADGLKLRAWLHRGDFPRLPVVVSHGLGDNLESFTDAATALGRRGHQVLLLDLRAHGGSEGRYTTLGGREREDVRAAVRYFRDHGHQRVILMGASMGAVATLRAAADDPDIGAVIAEAPYDNYRENVIHHASLYYGLPRWLPLIPAVIGLAEWRAGFDADEVDAVAAARRIHAPLLAIVDGADPRMPEPVVRKVFDAHPGPKQLWIATGSEHAGALFHRDYWKTVFGFLEKNGL